MKVKKINLAWIVVSDINKSRKFFTDTVGLTESMFDQNFGWLELKGLEDSTSLGVCGEYQGEKAGQNAVVTFTVDDLVEAKKELEQKGVKFIGEIMEVLGDVKLATFVDPDGNKFQLVEQLS